MKNIGKTIRAIRHRRDMSLNALSKSSSVSKSLLSDLENNKNKNPSVQTLHRIAVALKIQARDLL